VGYGLWVNCVMGHMGHRSQKMTDFQLCIKTQKQAYAVFDLPISCVVRQNMQQLWRQVFCRCRLETMDQPSSLSGTKALTLNRLNGC